MGDKIRIGSLISGGGTNLQAIIDSCQAGKIDGEMVFVGADNPDAKGLDRAKTHAIPTFVVDYGSIIRGFRETASGIAPPHDFDLDDIVAKQSLWPVDTDPGRVEAFMTTRAIAEAKLLEAMQAYPFDLLVLAGFMRNLTPYIIDRINTPAGNYRIMNIHPALLPAFPGVDGYGDTFRYGCKVGGCTVHFIDYGEDSGPIIGQKAYEIREDDTLESIKARGLELEWQLYPACIQLFARDRLQVVKTRHQLGKGREIQRSVVRILDTV